MKHLILTFVLLFSFLLSAQDNNFKTVIVNNSLILFNSADGRVFLLEKDKNGLAFKSLPFLTAQGLKLIPPSVKECVEMEIMLEKKRKIEMTKKLKELMKQKKLKTPTETIIKLEKGTNK